MAKGKKKRFHVVAIAADDYRRLVRLHKRERRARCEIIRRALEQYEIATVAALHASEGVESAAETQLQETAVI